MKQKLLISLICIISYSLNAHIELAFEALSQQQQKLHTLLCKQATIDRKSKEPETTNYFSVAFIFNFKNQEQLICSILCKNPQEDKPYNGCFYSNPKNSSFEESQKLKVLHNKINFGFPDIEDFTKKLLTNENTKLFSYITRKNKKGEQIDFANAYRFNDSEMQFLKAILSTDEDGNNDYLDSLINLINGRDITSVELHAFTTRDMCPSCYQHVKNFLLNFQKLFLCKIQKTNIPVTFFISSLVKLERAELKNSLYTGKYEKEISSRRMHCIFLRKSYDSPMDINTANNLDIESQKYPFDATFKQKVNSLKNKSINTASKYRVKEIKL